MAIGDEIAGNLSGDETLYGFSTLGLVFFVSDFSKSCKLGSKISSTAKAHPIRIAVGNVSLVDWDMFT